MASYVDDDEILDMYEERKREMMALDQMLESLYDEPDSNSRKTFQLAACTKRYARVYDSLTFLEEDVMDLFAEGRPIND